MDYNKTLEYIDSFIDFEKIPHYDYASSFRLERMHAFLQELGNPHQGLNVIHVAGSKGKGSTCIIIASLLKQAGYRVGLYTSPHLLEVNERIRILGEDSESRTQLLARFEGAIKKEEFVELVEKIRPVAERFRDHETLGRLSFFEVLTACAFLHFKRKEVEFAVLETGLGGRLDATNVTMSLVCGITNISLEHTDKLGDSLESIAREKAGIIKVDGLRLGPDSLVVSASQQKEATDIIRNVCQEKKFGLREIGRDVKYSVVYSGKDKQIFNLDGPGYSYKNLQLNLIGAHQVENAAIAIAMLRSIDKCILKMDEKVVFQGLKNISWPGRLQIIQERPYVVLDGAQNAHSIKRILASVKEIFSWNRLICVFGISRDKDIKGVSAELDKVSDVVILTRSRSSRAKDPIYLKENFSKAAVELSDDVEEALKTGLEAANKEDLILVSGSLYVVGDAIRYMNKRPHDVRV
ncbi:bifunctional folylpolyglutamate synthase/dihydrofolate synthase [Candidatus Omnitrophota bacterium]